MPDTLRDSVAAEAEAILLSVVHTIYQHDTYVDVATGTYDMDCSGYVGYVLQRIAPRHYQTIPSDSAADRPLAFDFYDLSASCLGKEQVGGSPCSPWRTRTAATSLPGDRNCSSLMRILVTSL
jgi:hypothetical protein